MRKVLHTALIAASLGLFAASTLNAQVNLIAIGSLTESKAGVYADLSGLDGVLENGAPANLLGGLGSGFAWAGDNTFLGLPDRGPNAVVFDALVDNTVTYIPRFHTIKMDLDKNKGAGLPFTLTPKLKDTTLLYSSNPLVYGTGAALAVGPGAPEQNKRNKFYFSGRSDNFDATRNSGNPRDARLDTESIRISNNGNRVFISDEYGPFVYEFDRWSGERTQAFKLPDNLFVTNLQPIGNDEISGNTADAPPTKVWKGWPSRRTGRHWSA
ncbi:MAG TPA: esterase-like activity of phytase family protein [Terriglobales bacterium]|nr:esterase-like activity of phytase family protein [Terriglobales bacterium]